MPAKRYFRFVEEGIEDLEYFINMEKSAEKDVKNVTEVSTVVKTSGYISENW